MKRANMYLSLFYLIEIVNKLNIKMVLCIILATLSWVLGEFLTSPSKNDHRAKLLLEATRIRKVNTFPRLSISCS